MIFRLDKHRIIYKQPPSILGVYLIFQPHIVLSVFFLYLNLNAIFIQTLNINIFYFLLPKPEYC